MIGAEAIGFQPMNRLVLVGARYSRSPAPLPGSYCAGLRAAKIEAAINSTRLRPSSTPAVQHVRFLFVYDRILIEPCVPTKRTSTNMPAIWSFSPVGFVTPGANDAQFPD
jgi:hypothetical protein